MRPQRRVSTEAAHKAAAGVAKRVVNLPRREPPRLLRPDAETGRLERHHREVGGVAETRPLGGGGPHQALARGGQCQHVAQEIIHLRPVLILKQCNV